MTEFFNEKGVCIARVFREPAAVPCVVVPPRQFLDTRMTASDFRLLSESEKYGAYADAHRER
jgi:hypothetical protein